MTHDEPRTIGTDAEFSIDRSQELAQLHRRHLAFWRHRDVTDAISASLHAGERMRVEQRMPVACQDLDGLVLRQFIEKMSGETKHAAFL